MRIVFLVLSMVMCLSSCTHKDSLSETIKYKDHFVQDSFPYTGTYHWKFPLMGGVQHSIHTLYTDSIQYTMTGSVYETSYTMKKLSYDDKDRKWIGQDEHGVSYVLFFRSKTDSSLTIYKHKCKKNGIAEAINFPLPAADATTDHGWNIYHTSHKIMDEILPLQGTYVNAGQATVIRDSMIIHEGLEYKKMSYHSGERRWVGQKDSSFLQIFVKDTSDNDTINLSVQEFQDLERAYNTKYQEVSFKPYTKE